MNLDHLWIDLDVWVPLPPDYTEFSGNLGEFGGVRGYWGTLRGIQWNSIGFCMALNRNSVGIAGGSRGNARCSRKIWDLGWFGAIWGLERLWREQTSLDSSGVWTPSISIRNKNFHLNSAISRMHLLRMERYRPHLGENDAYVWATNKNSEQFSTWDSRENVVYADSVEACFSAFLNEKQRFFEEIIWGLSTMVSSSSPQRSRPCSPSRSAECSATAFSKPAASLDLYLTSCSLVAFWITRYTGELNRKENAPPLPQVYLNNGQQMVSGEYGRGVSPDTVC